jgi:hypothetical protein
MKKLIVSLFLFAAAVVPAARAVNTVQSKPTASVPAGDDWIYIQGATNDVRKLSPTYYLPAATAATTYQPLDSDLTSIAALTTTSYGRSVLTLADAVAARSSFGLVIGTDIAAFSHTHPLSAITQSGATTGQVPQWNGSAWVPATVSGGGGGSGTVTSVAATVPGFLSVSGSPITSSGTLAITYSGTALPVANGGTGTTSPALVAGTNVTITGTWPNQTINASVSGGGGGDFSSNTSTSVDSEVVLFSGTAGKTGKRATGTGVAHLTSGVLSASAVNAASEVTGLLPVANGGTGTASPGIVAGTNVTVTGTWPNQTVNASGSGGSLPTQTSNEGGTLVTNGTAARWVAGLGPLGSELTASQRNLVFEGDSLTSIQSGNVEWPNRLMGKAGISTRGTYANFAQSGGVISDSVGRYTANVHPLRPTGSVKEAWLSFWCGTNNVASSEDGDSIFAEYQSYINTAKADGFKIIAFTLQDIGFTGAQETARVRFNTLVQRAVGLWDVLIPLDQMFPAVTDTTWFDGGIHLNDTGRQRLADYVYSVLTSGAVVPLPSPSVSIGAGDSQLSNNGLLKGTVRAYTKAQTQTRKTLTEAAPIAWDQSDAQMAAITLTANRTMGTPTGATSGGIYYLDVQYGGTYAMTWPTNFKWPAGTAPTQTSAVDKLDRYEFEFQGTYWLGRSVGANYAIPAPSSVVWEEHANATGTDQNMNATSADTISNGNNWTTRAGTWQRQNSSASIISSSGNALITMDSGASYADGVYIADVDSSVGQGGIVLNYVDNNNFWIFYQVPGTGCFLYENHAGTYDLRSIETTVNPSAGVHTVKLDKTGVNVDFYIDGTQVFGGTKDLSGLGTAHQTSTVFGLWMQSSSGKVDNVKFSHH